MSAIKITDDYKAKIKLWVAHPVVMPLPKPDNLPYFGHKRFNSYEEMNAWKKEYRAEIAKAGGIKWTK